jgi:hypothetical protein
VASLGRSDLNRVRRQVREIIEHLLRRFVMIRWE